MQSNVYYECISQDEIDRHIAEAKVMRSQAVVKAFKSSARYVQSLFSKLLAPAATLATK